MRRTVVAYPARDVEPRRWVCASGIARHLPRDRFDVQPVDPRWIPPEGATSGVLFLADSADVAACARFQEWKGLGVMTALVVTDPTRPLRVPPASVDAFLVESEWSADFLRRAYGIVARVISPRDVRPRPGPIEQDPRFVTFIDPVAANGADLFARLADELGRRRPDIPLLVVEGLATEADLVARGLDLRARANLHVMSSPQSSDEIWRMTRLLIAPCLDPWAAGILSEASERGIPIIAGEHPLLRELLPGDTAFLPTPSWMTPASLGLPLTEEVCLWIDEVILRWDREGEPRRQSLGGPTGATSRRRHEGELGEVISSILRPSGFSPGATIPAERKDWVVLVPFMDHIEPECEAALQALEMTGVRVVRCRGCSAIDYARCVLASEAVRRGSQSVLFIDSDVAFEPADALRLFARPEPVVAGIYAKKNAPALSSVFRTENASVTFGEASPGDYPLQYAAAGFLRIHTFVLHRMKDDLGLPLCNEQVGGGFWPFFHPMIVKGPDGNHLYLAEDWAFSHRLGQIGITPRADTTIRLFHVGMRRFTWEDTATSHVRHESFTFHFSGRDGFPRAL